MRLIDGVRHYSSEGTEYADALVAEGERLSAALNKPCGCREGECESKADRLCRMAVEIADGDQ